MSFNNGQPINRGSNVSLISSLGFDYTTLDHLLANGQWKESDRETEKKLLAVIGKDHWTNVNLQDLNNFSKEDLKIVDHLWVKYSSDRFGFSVQKDIWMACCGTPGVYNYEIEETFGDRIGWRKENCWLCSSELRFNLSAPKGHFPGSWVCGMDWTEFWWEGLWRGVGLYSCLFSRL